MFRGLFDFRNQKMVFRWEILSPIFFFFIISLFILYHQSNNTHFITSSFYKQILWFSIGFSAFIIVQFIRVQYLYDYSYFFYLLLFGVHSLFVGAVDFGVTPDGSDGCEYCRRLGRQAL